MGQIVFETALGYVALAERNRALLALTFGHSNERSTSRALASQLTDLELPANDSFVSEYYRDELIDRLREFARGEPIDFSDLEVETVGVTSFQRRVIDACRTISWGETLSYGELARRAGRSGAARAVGSVMAANRVPLVVPCHRVVAAGGGLGGYSAPQGLAMKRRLLAAEQEVSVEKELVAG
jgi:methylated-DNA-[protein]-cysteine S-methyltransferase